MMASSASPSLSSSMLRPLRTFQLLLLAAAVVAVTTAVATVSASPYPTHTRVHAHSHGNVRVRAPTELKQQQQQQQQQQQHDKVAGEQEMAHVLRGDGYVIHCVGHCPRTPTPSHATTSPAQALMGGHMYPGVNTTTDGLAYRWLMQHAGGGDFVVLTSDSDDSDGGCGVYNEYMHALSGLDGVDAQLRSVTSLCLYSRAGADADAVAARVKLADGFFFTGGDQAKYFHYWRGTAVAAGIARLVARGGPIGGSSAGLAVQGQFVFDALHGGISSHTALTHPFAREVTLTRRFLRLYHMRNVVTDTHFMQRDRMGRLVTFMARVALTTGSGQGIGGDDSGNSSRQHHRRYRAHGNNNSSHADGWTHGAPVRGVGVSEHTAVLMDGASGRAHLLGDGPAYFLTYAAPPSSSSSSSSSAAAAAASSSSPAPVCQRDSPLTVSNVNVWRWRGDDVGAAFDFVRWAPIDTTMTTTTTAATRAEKIGVGTHYSLNVVNGTLSSTQADGGIY